MAEENAVRISGKYANELDTADCIELLRAAGFDNADVSILRPENAHRETLKASEGAAVGAGLGGTLGWLAGSGALMIPGLGALAAGPIVAALSGAGVGGIAGAWIGGTGRGVLLSIECSDPGRAAVAQRILERTGAQGIRTN